MVARALMLFSRVLVRQINLSVVCRLKSIDRTLVDELNRVKLKDLRKTLDEQQSKAIVQLRTSLGGRFQSLQQFQEESKLPIDFDHFFGFLASLRNQTSDRLTRVHIEPRLTASLAQDIRSVCSVDYNSSYINWAIVATTKEKTHFEVRQWESVEIDLGRKYQFLRTFNQLSESLSTVPVNDASAVLAEVTTYRYLNPKLVSYIAQLQQIRAVLNTLLHCRLSSDQPVYHISGRDVGAHFGLYIGNEQSSAEFFLTNLIFNNTGTKQTISVDVEHQLKSKYHQASKGQKEPMAQCLLRALAFLQHVNEKKNSSSK